MLTREQADNIKKQLVRQIESSFPEDRKEFAISQIETMGSEQLEEFLVRNNLLKKQDVSQPVSGQCVFCSIVFGDINSYKIAENSKAIAVLEINPISRGHIIIIPKEHIQSKKDLPKEVHTLAKKVSSLIKSRLKPASIKIESSNILGHEIINVVPFYNNKEDYGTRKSASEEELSELQEIFKGKQEIIKPLVKRKGSKKMIKDFVEKIWLPKRIP